MPGATLDAASPIGNREIAEFLIANGARPTIFSASMLGQLDVVNDRSRHRPACSASRDRITLLRHAMARGPKAQALVDYLKGYLIPF